MCYISLLLYEEKMTKWKLCKARYSRYKLNIAVQYYWLCGISVYGGRVQLPFLQVLWALWLLLPGYSEFRLILNDLCFLSKSRFLKINCKDYISLYDINMWSLIQLSSCLCEHWMHLVDHIVEPLFVGVSNEIVPSTDWSKH